jgi:hypothetical protein
MHANTVGEDSPFFPPPEWLCSLLEGFPSQSVFRILRGLVVVMVCNSSGGDE